MFHPNLHPDLHLQAVSSLLSNFHLHTMSFDPLLYLSVFLPLPCLHCVSLFNAPFLTSPKKCVSPLCHTARRGAWVTCNDFWVISADIGSISVLEMLTRQRRGIQSEFIFGRELNRGALCHFLFLYSRADFVVM